MTKKTVKTTKKAIKASKKPVKKTVKKQEVVKMDLHKAFDLTDVSRETLESYAFYLKEMVNSAGWRLMVQVLESNLSLLEKQIVRKRDLFTGEAFTDEYVDSLRDQHEILSELIQKPHDLIKQYGKAEQPTPSPEYDPYGGDRHTINAATMGDTT